MIDASALARIAERYAEQDGDVESLVESALARLDWRRRHGFKECSTCHLPKDVTEFGRDSTRRDGLEPRCRDCRRVNASPATD